MSDPVTLTLDASGIAEVRLVDEAGRNSFTSAFCRGLESALDSAVRHRGTRVILVSGLPTLFCSGGSREELLSFARGDGRFDTDDFFRAFVRCPLPVVSAMQGHALGGGLVLGLYADLSVLSERSVYTANFMDYGFTPGMGATHLLPHRFGSAIGTEMLLTSRRYRGHELRERGTQVRIVAHADVPAVARALAEDVARAPRPSLELLKRHLAASLLAATDTAIAEEAAMHEVSFRLPEVTERIAARHGATHLEPR